MSSIEPYLPIIYDLALDCENITEIGVHRGNTTNIILKACEITQGRLTSIDKNDPLVFSTNSKKWLFIKSDCLDYYPDKNIDFLLIDCDPSVELTRKILDRYGKFVKKYIVIHDTIFYQLNEILIEWAVENGFWYLELDKKRYGLMILWSHLKA